MEKDTDVIKELQELNRKVAHLEKMFEELKYETRKSVKWGEPVCIFLGAVKSLLFGLFIVGPVIVLVVTVVMYALAWIGEKI
ncbi:hypothetical protein COE51_21490 [Bacillus pseudomycoides]|nr:hypothetical protein COE51_21490 [Bacillus pseudomycoides]